MELKDVKGSTYIIESQEEEIKRIALELHEGISQNLYSLYTGLEFLRTGVEQDHLKDYTKEMSDLVSRTLQEVRLLSVELYPSTLKTLGLYAALKSYIKLFTSTFGIIINISTVGNEMELTEQKSMAIFRSCQEALINIAKYADTSEATVHFTWEEKRLKIDISDHGVGFDLQEIIRLNKCKGIAAMKQRMSIAGGELCLFSGEGEGTTVSFILTIQK
ncbi:histidine kinase [Aquibacillus koreensis]|uniref:histidine kinase n=1 Tax=Aquibacillus koreensis TaxID=279446 RepID=A0A9X4AI43_9BACI|nr:histidine kinase [Aquibacillus koreensis]MCT2535898.1 histidine kinase [Aquibacillus koreensis]MDC3420354.1 histidine kinase [Aquibacillus koreensis]